MTWAARLRHKNSRLLYFGRHVAKLLAPRALLERRRRKLLVQIDAREREAVEARVRYYNKLSKPFVVPDDVAPLRLWHARDLRNYYFDLLEYLRYFPPHLRSSYRFGDDSSVPGTPTLVKARPIAGDHANAVLFKLDRVRHFLFVKDRRAFSEKLDRLVWRGHAAASHRVRFLEQYSGHELCDVGQVGRRGPDRPWGKPFMSIDQHLDYKFILSIEGHDVATNLKWILSSNSLCFMARPKIESWFMEGTLIPDQHYVLLADDYSDLDEKLRFYSRNPAGAQRILDNAHAFVAPFRNLRREMLVSLLVLQRYFELSGQLPSLQCEGRAAPRRVLGDGRTENVR
jgi:hypothetical protein